MAARAKQLAALPKLALAHLGVTVLDLGCGAGEPVAPYVIERRCAVDPACSGHLVLLTVQSER